MLSRSLLILFCYCHNLFSIGLPVIDAGSIAKSITIIRNQAMEFDRVQNRFNYQMKAAKRFIDKLDGYRFTDIKSLIKQIDYFNKTMRKIGYDYNSVIYQFEKLYRGQGKDFHKKHSQWEKQTDQSIQEAIQGQALLKHSSKQMTDLKRAITAKNNAEGSAEALQAIGEINAIQVKQFNDLKHIIATDARARQSFLMEKRAQEKADKEYERHLMKGFNKPSTPMPLARFPSLGETAPRIQAMRK